MLELVHAKAPVELREAREKRLLRARVALWAENQGITHQTNLEIYYQGYLAGATDAMQAAFDRGIVLCVEEVVRSG